jgi:hypothetical protein
VEAFARVLMRTGSGTRDGALLKAFVGGLGSAIAAVMLVAHHDLASVPFAVLSVWCWACFGVVWRWGRPA